MNEKHVVSLSLAKQFKEAGWNKETEFWWVKRHEGWAFYLEYGHPVAITLEGEVYSAPLATEILGELPDRLTEGERNYFLTIWKENKSYYVQYEINRSTLNCASKEFHEEYLPNALAKMWLYLKQNNLLKKES